MADLKAPERNPVIGRLADILLSGKNSANTYEMKDWVPLVGGMGLGDMFMGKAPELADDASYNLRSLIRGGNQATGGLGTYTLDPRTADAAMLGTDVAGIGAGLGGLSKRSASAIYDKLSSGGTSLSRRDALKKLGAITGGAAVTGGTLGVARKLLDNVATDVAPKIADNVAVQAAKKYRYNSIPEYLAGIKTRIDRGEHNLLPFQEDEYIETTNDAIKALLKQDERIYNETKSMFKFAPESWNESFQYNMLSPQAKQEMKNFKAATAKLESEWGGKYAAKDAWADWFANRPNMDAEYFSNVLKNLE